MEQSVWLVFGVISVILGLSIIIGLQQRFNDDRDMESIVWSLDRLQSDIEFVCKTPLGTRISSEVTLPSGMVLNATGDRLCIVLENQVRCRFTECLVHQPYLLDLNTTEARSSFKYAEYRCYIENVEGNVTVECQG